MSEPSPQTLAQDFRTLVQDAEQLLRHAVRDAGQGYSDARGKLEASVGQAKARLGDLEKAVAEGVTQAGRATDDYVRRHPWESVGVGAGIGLLVGLLLGRK